jgi:hypothetical protein
MKIISQILSLFLSEMKPWQIYMVLVFIILTLEVGWTMFFASISHAVNFFVTWPTWTSNQAKGGLSLCH